ncbi:peptidoglycan-binding protein [Rothia dentocariosa]|uniref:peptidoglycan-binding protein n=1 Tax=Rothia dentocariosa TaxID=2047 RepID=UPI00195CADCD|nr:peptidoglycan-binding protein [Rothia dentocariosa]VTY12538.1 Putative peptidoglycan binding domain protein [Rothia dentocariosa]
MTLENTGISRRKLLRTTAIGVPAAGMLAFGSTLVTATSANALEVDGYWGSETTRMYQRLAALAVVDGIVSSQPASQASANPGLTSGWDWVSDDAASGSETIKDLQRMLKVTQDGLMGSQTISALQARYHLPQDGVLSEESPTIKKLQSELIVVTYD